MLRGREPYVTGPRPVVAEPSHPDVLDELEAGLPPLEPCPGVPGSVGTFLPPVCPGAHSFSNRRTVRNVVRKTEREVASVQTNTQKSERKQAVSCVEKVIAEELEKLERCLLATIFTSLCAVVRSSPTLDFLGTKRKRGGTRT